MGHKHNWGGKVFWGLNAFWGQITHTSKNRKEGNTIRPLLRLEWGNWGRGIKRGEITRGVGPPLAVCGDKTNKPGSANFWGDEKVQEIPDQVHGKGHP